MPSQHASCPALGDISTMTKRKETKEGKGASHEITKSRLLFTDLSAASILAAFIARKARTITTFTAARGIQLCIFLTNNDIEGQSSRYIVLWTCQPQCYLMPQNTEEKRSSLSAWKNATMKYAAPALSTIIRLWIFFYQHHMHFTRTYVLTISFLMTRCFNFHLFKSSSSCLFCN